MGERWTDLLDPDADQVRARVPVELYDAAVAQLTAPSAETRPTIENHGPYILGVLIAPAIIAELDLLYYQEIDFILTEDSLLTVRKSPPGKAPFDISDTRRAQRSGEAISMQAYKLVDSVAARYLEQIDELNSEIDELEDNVEIWSPERVRVRLSDLRHDVSRLRRTLGPTRDAVHRIVSGRLDAEGKALFPREVELHFADVYDKLLEASEMLELSRDLVASARDYHQAQIAHDQNEVMKRLTILTALFLFPTFVVGVYGQNFRHLPELPWRLGYAWSWFLILAWWLVLWLYMRRKRWI